MIASPMRKISSSGFFRFLMFRGLILRREVKPELFRMSDNRPRCTILVVDDDPMLLNLIQKCMKKEGYLTAGTRTGEETAEWLSRNRADLMLLDFRLPDMDAEELAGILAENGDLVPYIVFTGHESVQTSVRMLKKGARDYLMKDGSFLELLPTVVDQILEQLEKERKLAETEAKLREMFVQVEKSRDDILSIMNTLRIGTAMTDENGLLTFISKMCKLIVGEEGVIGNHWESTCPFKQTDKSLKLRTSREQARKDIRERRGTGRPSLLDGCRNQGRPAQFPGKDIFLL